MERGVPTRTGTSRSSDWPNIRRQAQHIFLAYAEHFTVFNRQGMIFSFQKAIYVSEL